MLETEIGKSTTMDNQLSVDKRHAAEQRVTKKLIMLSVTTVFTIIPFACLVLSETFPAMPVVKELEYFIYFCVSSQALFNPILLLTYDTRLNRECQIWKSQCRTSLLGILKQSTEF